MAMEWTNNHDIALAREVLLLEPYRHKARTVERGKVWQKIADNLNSHAVLRFLVTKRSVREHLKLLLDKYRAIIQKERRESGGNGAVGRVYSHGTLLHTPNVPRTLHTVNPSSLI